MCAIAERFIDGSATATERERSFAREIILSAVDIDQFDRTFGSLDAQRPIRTDSNLDLRHVKILQPYGFLVSLKKISRKSSGWRVTGTHKESQSDRTLKIGIMNSHVSQLRD